MRKIIFSPEIPAALPDFRMLLIEADIINRPTNDELWEEICVTCREIGSRFKLEMVRHRPAIDATRAAYKRFGKEPNRYRPSAEALMRRAVKGMELYRSLSAIDLVNLVSLKTGYSIGGFDADKIDGDTLTLGVGREGEPYEGIGRGMLNIAGMPVYRDATGGIGTPTSDNERTKLTTETRRILLTVNIYGESEISDEETVGLFARLLEQYASAKNFSVTKWRV